MCITVVLVHTVYQATRDVKDIDVQGAVLVVIDRSIGFNAFSGSSLLFLFFYCFFLVPFFALFQRCMTAYTLSTKADY